MWLCGPIKTIVEKNYSKSLVTISLTVCQSVATILVYKLFNLMVIRCSTISTLPMRINTNAIHNNTLLPVELLTCVFIHKIPLDEIMKHEQERQCHWIIELILLLLLLRFVGCAHLTYDFFSILLKGKLIFAVCPSNYQINEQTYCCVFCDDLNYCFMCDKHWITNMLGFYGIIQILFISMINSFFSFTTSD